MSSLLLIFSIFFKFLVPPGFHFSAKMSDIRRYVWYSLVRSGILSGTNYGYFYTDSPAGTINSDRTGRYGTKLTTLGNTLLNYKCEETSSTVHHHVSQILIHQPYNNNNNNFHRITLMLLDFL